MILDGTAGTDKNGHQFTVVLEFEYAEVTLMLSRIFDSYREEVTGELRNFRNEELHTLYS